MPVLKTVGKNLFDIDKAVKIDKEKFNETNYVSNNNGVLTVVADKSIEFVISKERFEVNTQYTLSFKVLGTAAFHSGWIKIYHTDGSEKTLTNSATPNVESFIKITSDANKTVDRISIFGNGLTTPEFYDIQVEKGVQSSSYEPYKSGILTDTNSRFLPSSKLSKISPVSISRYLVEPFKIALLTGASTVLGSVSDP